MDKVQENLLDRNKLEELVMIYKKRKWIQYKSWNEFKAKSMGVYQTLCTFLVGQKHIIDILLQKILGHNEDSIFFYSHFD